jgi:hypothetical protein
LRRAGGGGVTAGRVLRSPVRRCAALVGGGIAAAPKVHTGGTRHGKHAPPARPVRTLAVRALRVFALCASAAHDCVPVLWARCTCAVCRRYARALAVCARAVHPRAGRVGHLCSVRPDRATSARQRRRHRGGAPARALCWRCAYLRCRACVPCSRCVYLLCMRLLCMLAVCALALPMLALRAPAVPVLAVRACAVCLRAVCGVFVQRSSTPCGTRRPCIPVDPGDLP